MTVGSRDVAITVLRDGADNWFVQPRAPVARGTQASSRARLVMEIAAPRAAFGGPIADSSWGDLAFVPPLPDNVARDAALVRTAIGITRSQRPREVIAKLVHYFRSFSDSDDPPRGSRSLYLDLALSKKGVCRHRAFAFLVTAQSLGIPTRLAMNEAHAWVEVNDGTAWRRIDLGGAGELTSPVRDPDRVPYEWPADPFAWPQGAVRGEEMIADARTNAQGPGAGSSKGGSSQSSAPAPAPASSAAGPAPAPSAERIDRVDRDDRPPSTVTVTVDAADVKRGASMAVHGSVRADHDGCPHLAVEVWMSGPGQPAPAAGSPPAPPKLVQIGTLATDDQGDFDGRVVVPASVTLGDYDVVARTGGDSRCGPSVP
jgi:hypothetical protein